MQYLLQQYDDGTFGYKGIDDITYDGMGYDKKIILEQSPNETREDFIERNNIEFKNGEYGSNETKDKIIISWDYVGICFLIDSEYGLDRIIKIDRGDILEYFAKHILNSNANNSSDYCNDYSAYNGCNGGYKEINNSSMIDRYLDILVNSNYYKVRREVAKYGRHQDLDILVYDNDTTTREYVARHARIKDLKILINDKKWIIRYIVALQNYGLNVLIHDNENDSINYLAYDHLFDLTGIDVDENSPQETVDEALRIYKERYPDMWYEEE